MSVAVSLGNHEAVRCSEVSKSVESAVYLVRDYWLREGEKIISDFLESKDAQAYKVKDDKQSIMALQATILDRMIDELLTQDENGQQDIEEATKMLEAMHGIDY